MVGQPDTSGTSTKPYIDSQDTSSGMGIYNYDNSTSTQGFIEIITIEPEYKPMQISKCYEFLYFYTLIQVMYFIWKFKSIMSCNDYKKIPEKRDRAPP